MVTSVSVTCNNELCLCMEHVVATFSTVECVFLVLCLFYYFVSIVVMGVLKSWFSLIYDGWHLRVAD